MTDLYEVSPYISFMFNVVGVFVVVLDLPISLYSNKIILLNELDGI